MRLCRDGDRDRKGRRPNPIGNRNEGLVIVAYANNISDWQDVALSEKALKAIRAIMESEFKAAGGRGELPRIVATKNILKGTFAVDARCFEAGNEAAPNDEMVTLAKAWAEAIAAGHNALADLAAWPDVQKMVATMLKPALPAMPAKPALPAMPKAPAGHSVKPVKRRAA